MNPNHDILIRSLRGCLFSKSHYFLLLSFRFSPSTSQRSFGDVFFSRKETRQEATTNRKPKESQGPSN